MVRAGWDMSMWCTAQHKHVIFQFLINGWEVAIRWGLPSSQIKPSTHTYPRTLLIEINQMKWKKYLHTSTRLQFNSLAAVPSLRMIVFVKAFTALNGLSTLFLRCLSVINKSSKNKLKTIPQVRFYSLIQYHWPLKGVRRKEKKLVCLTQQTPM